MISCTPNPILKYRTDAGAVKKKRCTSPPPPPPSPQRGFSALAGIRAKRTKYVCALQNEIVPYAYDCTHTKHGLLLVT